MCIRDSDGIELRVEIGGATEPLNRYRIALQLGRAPLDRALDDEAQKGRKLGSGPKGIRNQDTVETLSLIHI